MARYLVAIPFFLILIIGGTLGVYKVAQAQQNPVTRGEYLVTASPCAECHTPRLEGNPAVLDMSKFLAGGEEFNLGPAGVVYAANLTADPDTGLGNWSDDEIIAAIRDGIGKDGEKLVVMPWEEYRGMAKSDIEAIVAYLHTVPAISNAVPEAELNVPRDALYAEAAASADSLGPTAPPTETLWKGEYLVKSVLGCRGCHGPDLSGGVPPFFAPNITPDKGTGIGNWSIADIATAMGTGVTPSGRQLAPVFPYVTAYVNLTDSDANAVAQYLKVIPPVSKVVVPPGPPPAGDTSLPYAIGALALMGILAVGAGLKLVWARR